MQGQVSSHLVSSLDIPLKFNSMNNALNSLRVLIVGSFFFSFFSLNERFFASLVPRSLFFCVRGGPTHDVKPEPDKELPLTKDLNCVKKYKEVHIRYRRRGSKQKDLGRFKDAGARLEEIS